MTRWSWFMYKDEHNPGPEPIGDSKLDIADRGRGCSRKRELYVT